MLDILSTVLAWRDAGRRVAIATLVEVERSAPRDVGATIAVNDAGEVAGSLSGGCVESQAYLSAKACLDGATPSMYTYGNDDDSTDGGLTCGGTLRVFVRALTPTDDAILRALERAVASESTIVIATQLDGAAIGSAFAVTESARIGELGSPRLERTIEAETRTMTGAPFTTIRSYGYDGEPLRSDVRLYVQSFAPKPDMFVVGAVDFSRAMASIGRFLGYRVTVIDARAVFATSARIPDADRIVVAWPDEFLRDASIRASTAIVVLTHDEKFDVPLLAVALESEAGYIGVMGSRPTHAKRVASLEAIGVSRTGLARLHAPIGLDIGARSPEETAISIAAEIVATRNGRSGGSLRDGSASLHGPIVPRAVSALRSA